MKSLIFCAFSALLVVINAQAGTLTPDNCYYEYLNTKVMCLDAWEVCKNIANCQDCMAICTQFSGICQAVMYRQSTQECYVYRTAVKPSYARRKRAAGCYGNMPPTLIKNQPDYTYYIVSNSSSCNPTYGGATQATQPPAPITTAPVSYKPVTQTPATPPPPPPVTTKPPGPIPPPPPTTTMPPGPIPPPPTPTPVIPDAPSTPAAPLPPQATCPTGQFPIFTEFKGNQLSGTPDSQFQASSEQVCTQACLANQQPTGVISPCQSADFNTASMQCSFFLNASPPTGTGQIAPATGVNHYEKTCMDTTLVQNCPGPIIKQPQKLLVGYAESVVTASSELDCITQCMQSQQRFGFQCMSGMFYTTETTNNCILNSESATTQPTLFTDENADKVNYFEPLCTGGGAAGPPMSSKKGPAPTHKRPQRDTPNLKPTRKRNIIWPNVPNWGSWTRCDGKESVRYHYRNCKSYNPNKCEVGNEKCDPSNRSKELADIAAEETGGGNDRHEEDKHDNGRGNDKKDIKKGDGVQKESEREQRKNEHDNKDKNKKPRK